MGGRRLRALPPGRRGDEQEGLRRPPTASSAEAIKQYPNHVLAYYLRGQAALAQSRWEAAVAAFTRVTELYPGSIAGFKSLGIASEELGRTDDAAARLRGGARARRPTDDELPRAARLPAAPSRARGAGGGHAARARGPRLEERGRVDRARARTATTRATTRPPSRSFVRATRAARRRARVVQPGRGAAQARQPSRCAPGLRARPWPTPRPASRRPRRSSRIKAAK